MKHITTMGVMLAGLAVTPAFADADWHDFEGKTLIVELKVTGRTVTDTIKGRGGAATKDEVSSTDCEFTYHVYVSSKGRMFEHLVHMDCVDTDPYDFDKPSGSIYDLTTPEGMTDNGGTSAPQPYSLRVDGDELVIDLPMRDSTWRGDGYVTTFTNSSGGYTLRLRAAPDCAYSMEGESAYRMEFDSTTSDYYSLADNEVTYRMETLSCHIVDGFMAR